MMKVCVLGCKSFPPGKWAGGIETNVHEVVSRLGNGKVDFYILTRQGTGKGVIKVPYVDFRLTRTPSHNLFSIPQAKRLIELEGIDFIHAHESFAGVAARILKRLTGIPYLLTMHAIDSDQPEWAGLRGPLACVERLAIGGADMITCPGPLIRERLISEKEARKDTTIVIPNGVDLERYGKTGRHAAKKSLNAPKKNIILFSGRLTESKGLFVLLEAMRSLDGHVLWIAGSGPLEPQLRKAAPKNVRFLGFRRDMPELLAAADIFILPSFSEGQPISLLEAMAAGTPAIASRVGEIPSVLGKAGIIVSPGSALDIVSAVKRLEDKNLASRLASMAKQRAKEYGWDAVAEKFYAVYRKMLEKKR